MPHQSLKLPAAAASDEATRRRGTTMWPLLGAKPAKNGAAPAAGLRRPMQRPKKTPGAVPHKEGTGQGTAPPAVVSRRLKEAAPASPRQLSTKQRFYAGKAAAGAAPTQDLPRLAKLLADRGLCSRRKADEWIANGWVRVGGKVVHKPGTRVPPDARIDIDAAATG